MGLKLCFVIGPIGPEDSDVRTHADWLLEEIIQPVMNDFPEYQVRRADQDHRPGLIDAQLINDLLTAELVIADLSGLNPNAFYEIGIRHVIQKPIIHMQLAAETIPFDVSLYRAIKFSRVRPRDLKAAREALRSQVKAVNSEGYEVENPVTRARGIIKFDEHATPPQKVLIDQIDALSRRLANIEESQDKWNRGRGSQHRADLGGRVSDVLRLIMTPPNYAKYLVTFPSSSGLEDRTAILEKLRKQFDINSMRVADSGNLEISIDERDASEFEKLAQMNDLTTMRVSG
jgi:hypothetical protein